MIPRHSREGGNPEQATDFRVLQPFVYILASGRNGTLYCRRDRRCCATGVDPPIRHPSGIYVNRLVYVEAHATMLDAIQREKQLKKWRRAWKLRLIEETNPQWRDLYDDLLK
jgi:putative endonuclease